MTNAAAKFNNFSTPAESSGRVKFGELLRSSDPDNTGSSSSASDPLSPRRFSFNDTSSSLSPYSPYINSPWIKLSPPPLPRSDNLYLSRGRNCLIGSLRRQEGHVYSMAVYGGTLYTGSESRNIRVWRNFQDAGGFKSGSGLVKAILVSPTNNRVFTGHLDGKIRIWTRKGRRVGTLPKLGEYLKSYVDVRIRHPRIKHLDAVSCLALNEESGVLYSGSWDKTIKVWRVSDGKYLESIEAHDDAINSMVVGLEGMVFSGSADGTVKVWRRELHGKVTRHFQVRTLLKQENAVTSLAIADNIDDDDGNAVVYCGSSDGLVNFWEKEELLYGGVLRGHKMAVLCLSASGCLVLSGSADKTICLWRRDKEAHSCLAVLAGHEGPVKCLAAEVEEEEEEEEEESRKWIVYSGSLDNSIKIWRISEKA